MIENTDGISPAKIPGDGGKSGSQEGTATRDSSEAFAPRMKDKKRVRNYKRHAKKLISEEFLSIMEAMARRSVEGSLAHTKYLFEIGGVKEDIERQGRGKAEPSLAQLLVAEIRKRRADELPVYEDETCAG